MREQSTAKSPDRSSRYIDPSHRWQYLLPNRDGFGFILHPKRLASFQLKSTQPLNEDARGWLGPILAWASRSKTMVGHIRFKTGTATHITNTHPFEINVGKGPNTVKTHFVHNGSINGIEHPTAQKALETLANDATELQL